MRLSSLVFFSTGAIFFTHREANLMTRCHVKFVWGTALLVIELLDFLVVNFSANYNIEKLFSKPPPNKRENFTKSPFMLTKT
jgi:hypothetical protein